MKNNWLDKTTVKFDSIEICRPLNNTHTKSDNADYQFRFLVFLTLIYIYSYIWNPWMPSIKIWYLWILSVAPSTWFAFTLFIFFIVDWEMEWEKKNLFWKSICQNIENGAFIKEEKPGSPNWYMWNVENNEKKKTLFSD